MKKFRLMGVLGLSVVLAGCTLPGGAKQTSTTTTTTIEDPSTGKEVVVAMTPQQTVESYMRATLGKLSDSAYNEEVAKTYLADDLRAQFTDSGFVPMSYGFQDGPDRVEIVDTELLTNEATVVVKGYWGADSGMNWMFSLIKVEGAWKIAGINPGQ